MTSTCFICETPLEQEIPHRDDYYQISCRRCGEYKIAVETAGYIDHRLAEILKKRNIRQDIKQLRHNLCCYIRERFEFGPPLDVITDIEKLYTSVEIPTTMLEKAYKIIRYLGKKSTTFGQEIKISSASDYPIAYARNHKEFYKLLRYLGESKFITIPNINSSTKYISLRMEGWQLFEENEKRRPDSKQCFVAMSFDPRLNDVYRQGIEKAIEDAGFEARRIDKEDHNNKICDEIIAKIRKSKFIVADFTQQKQGVYFEAGFAMGLDIPVIWLCRKDDIDNLHFDTRQYNHILWEDSKDLYTKLYNRIKATIV